MDQLNGRVWKKTIDKEALDDHRAKYEVISTRLFAGRTVIHVLSDRRPGEGFEPVPGGLEDVYFSTLSAPRATSRRKTMFWKVAAFEFRYQLRQPVFWVIAIIFALLAFGLVAASDNISIGAGGNVHKNAPYALASINAIMSMFFMFATTAFVANVVVRDDQTGFGPMVQSTRMTQVRLSYGRFAGAFAAAALCFLVISLGVIAGTIAPWVDTETIGAVPAVGLPVQLPDRRPAGRPADLGAVLRPGDGDAVDDGDLCRRGRRLHRLSGGIGRAGLASPSSRRPWPGASPSAPPPSDWSPNTGRPPSGTR